MARNSRNTIILAKIETTPGIDAVPTGAANALLVSDPTSIFLTTTLIAIWSKASWAQMPSWSAHGL